MIQADFPSLKTFIQISFLHQEKHTSLQDEYKFEHGYP